MKYEPPTGIILYQLLEDIPNDERDFDGKKGDILVGGGSGEAPALRISYPLAFKFFALDDGSPENEAEFEYYSELFKAFWTPREAYIIGEGFYKIGWSPEERDLDMWLAENICFLLIQEMQEFNKFNTELRENTSCLRLFPYNS